MLPRIALFLFVLLFINNCGGIQQRPTQDTPLPRQIITVPEKKAQPQLKPDYTRPEQDFSSVRPLIEQAEYYEKGGNFESAAAMLERAIQVTPGNAEVWHRLARVRLKQGNLELAAQLAHKSNSLLRDNYQLEKENEKIFSEIAKQKRN